MKRWIYIGLAATLLLAFGALVIFRPSSIKNNRLAAACAEGNLDTVEKLLRAGAEINYRTTGTGYTPLHWAIYEENFEIARLLIDRGAEANISDEHGETALDLLKKSESPDAVQVLHYIGQKQR